MTSADTQTGSLVDTRGSIHILDTPEREGFARERYSTVEEEFRRSRADSFFA